MFIPEYSITHKILRSIGIIEYSKAIIDTATILPAWEDNLIKSVKISTVYAISRFNGLNVDDEDIKKYIDNLSFTIPQESKNLAETYDIINEITRKNDLEESDIRYIHKNISRLLVPKTKQGIYRTVKFTEKPDPEELLAKVTELIDWYNSMEAKESHPVLNTAILRGAFEALQPFESYNDMTADLCTIASLRMSGYNLNGMLSVSSYYIKSQREYEQSLSSLIGDDPDFTRWLEYFTDGLATESSKVKDKVLALEQDTKVAKASGRIRLSDRQERIIAHLQDYGQLQNKDFTAIFPDISEDTVLRDLKDLINRGLVVKKGRTKSSRYELK